MSVNDVLDALKEADVSLADASAGRMTDPRRMREVETAIPRGTDQLMDATHGTPEPPYEEQHPPVRLAARETTGETLALATRPARQPAESSREVAIPQSMLAKILARSPDIISSASMMTGGLSGSLIGAAALPAMGLGIPAVAGAAAVGLTGATIGGAPREVFKNPDHRAEVYAALGASARFGAQAAMAFGQFKLQSAAIGAQLTLGLMDRGLDAVDFLQGRGVADQLNMMIS